MLTIYVSRKYYHNCGGIKLNNISKIILITAAAASMTSCSIGGKSSEVSSDKKTDTQSITYNWQAPYEEKINEFKGSEAYTETSAFDIFDVTGDGAQELIISPSEDATAKCIVYTCKGQTIEQLGEIGTSGSFAYSSSLNIIIDEFKGNGFVLGKIFSFADGPLKTIISYSNNSDSASLGASIYHEINGENISGAEYNKALEPYTAVDSIKVGRRFSMGDNAVNYGLRIAENWGGVLSDDRKKLCTDKLSEELAAAQQEGRNAAFDFCDLNGDKTPELVISENDRPESKCSVYYFSGSSLMQMDGTYGINGTFSFDTSAYIFFEDNAEQSKYWSIANSSFVADEYQKSDSIISVGRKYPLCESGISAIFG